MNKKSKELAVGRRIMDVAWHRDKHGNIYHGEALVLAMMLRARSRLTRESTDAKLIGKMFDDPNL